MALLHITIKETYNYIFYELADERTRHMFPAPWVMMTILPFYLYFTRSLGPKLMANRDPYSLRTVIFYYNLFQIYICGYILYLVKGVGQFGIVLLPNKSLMDFSVVKGLRGGWMNGYNYTCQPVDITENPISRSMINAAWWYTVVKLIDLMDTVFFVLRKKDRQISFLHLFHHFMMPIASYICLKYFPNERTRHMFPAPWVMMTILPFYLYFTRSLGPKLMANRDPYSLRTVIFYYNLFQIYICGYILYLGLRGGWMNGYNYTCQPVDITENPISRSMINAAWWYTVVKLIDLMDTVFFVLRKKDRQISFLHLFHHFMMPIASYICLKYFPNGHGTSVGLLNTVVHVVMYTYYLIAGMGPKYQKYLWWKKYVTIMQIVQFLAIFTHNTIALVNKDCEYPKWISTLLCIHSLHFVYLFGNFYYKNYIKKPKETNTSKQRKL